MKKVVRESKFRHCFGRVAPKDQHFDGVVASDSRLDGNICALNRRFIAVTVATSGGGAFTVLRRDRPGRIDRVYRFTGHASEIVDLSFDPFHVNRLASGCDDGSVRVWVIPIDGLESDLNEFYCQFKASTRRCIQVTWHPSADNVLFGVNIDCISIFNVKSPSLIRTIDTSEFSDQMFAFGLNYNGSECVTSFKDKNIRVFDLMSGQEKVSFSSHEGTKPIKVQWMTGVYNDNVIISTGATRGSVRQMCAWDITSPGQPLCVEELDNASAPLNIFYDHDTHLIVLHSKGESLRLYEFDMEPEPKFHLISTHSSQDSHRACAFGNKLSCSSKTHEIITLLRVCAKSLEPVAIVVPRKSEHFQEDLFPPTPGETPAMDVDDFIAGKTADPVLISLKDFMEEETSSSIQAESGACVTVNKTLSENLSSKASSFKASDFSNELAELKSQLAELRERVDRLEGQ